MTINIEGLSSALKEALETLDMQCISEVEISGGIILVTVSVVGKSQWSSDMQIIKSQVLDKIESIINRLDFKLSRKRVVNSGSTMTCFLVPQT